MKICIAGKNNIAINVCSYILNNYPDLQIMGVVNRTDDGIDRFQRSYLKYLKDKGIPIVTLKELYTIPDLFFFSLEYDRIIKPYMFSTNKIYNVHFSFLPKYKGMYTSALPILHGAKESGVSLHLIDSGIDTGDILFQEKIELRSIETAKSLYLKYIKAGTSLVIDNFRTIVDGSYIAVRQKREEATYYSKNALDYSNLKIDLNVTAWQLSSQVRAFNFRDYQLPNVCGHDIVAMEIVDNRSCQPAGSIIEENEDYICLSTIDYDVLLFKDKQKEFFEYCAKNDLVSLKRIPKLSVYIHDSEKTHGWTPLMVAAYNNSIEVCEFLIKEGADVNACNFNGTTVVMYAKDAAIQTSNYDIIDMLLRAGANVFVKDNFERDIFDYLEKQSIEILQYIKKWLSF